MFSSYENSNILRSYVDGKRKKNRYNYKVILLFQQKNKQSSQESQTKSPSKYEFWETYFRI